MLIEAITARERELFKQICKPTWEEKKFPFPDYKEMRRFIYYNDEIPVGTFSLVPLINKTNDYINEFYDYTELDLLRPFLDKIFYIDNFSISKECRGDVRQFINLLSEMAVYGLENQLEYYIADIDRVLFRVITKRLNVPFVELKSHKKEKLVSSYIKMSELKEQVDNYRLIKF